MKKALLTGIAALLLATGAAHAWERSITFLEQFLPPKQFDHEYNGVLTVFKELKQEDLPCRSMSRVERDIKFHRERWQDNRTDQQIEVDTYGYRPFACTHANHSGPGTRAIWILKRDEIEYEGWNYDIIMRHEIGHCNGWHHD